MPEPIKPKVAQAVSQPAQPAPTVPASQPVAEAAPAAPAPVAPAVVESPLPGASDRTTEQFDKLLESNQRLYDANEQLSQELSRRAQATQTFQPIQQPVAQTEAPKVGDFTETNPLTGEQSINVDKFNASMKTFAERTSRAEQAVNSYIQTSEQREIDRQNKEAFAAHPELDPKSTKFDAQLSDLTRAVIYDSLINEQRYGGKPLSFKESADFVKSKMAGSQTPAPVQAQPDVKPTAQAQATQEAKEQGSLSAVGSSQPVTEPEVTLDQLRQMTRQGGPQSDQAIMARLANIDHTRKTSEEEA